MSAPARPPAREDVITFRVYLKSLYFQVYVWRTKALMYRALPNNAPYNFGAICRCSDVYNFDGAGHMRHSPRLGEIHFHWKEFNTTSVAHEATHAALAWVRRKHIDLNAALAEADNSDKASPDEERFCYAVCDLTYQIADKGVKHKLAEWTND
jgi:hypothetical protein